MASDFRELFFLIECTVPLIFLGWGFLSDNHSMKIDVFALHHIQEYPETLGQEPKSPKIY